MKNRILVAATAALLALPLLLNAADSAKKKKNTLAPDTDGDGMISQAEYLAAMKGKMDPAAAKAKFAELDQNKDGLLSREEYTAGNGRKSAKKKKDGS